MSPRAGDAERWTCDRCDVCVSQVGGGPIPLPGTWMSSVEGRFCLLCRRERAGDAALESVPADGPRDAAVQLRRAAMIEFEVRRTPEQGNGTIAKACRSSVSAVSKARSRLGLPDPPASPGKRAKRREPAGR